MSEGDNRQDGQERDLAVIRSAIDASSVAIVRHFARGKNGVHYSKMTDAHDSCRVAGAGWPGGLSPTAPTQ